MIEESDKSIMFIEYKYIRENLPFQTEYFNKHSPFTFPTKKSQQKLLDAFNFLSDLNRKVDNKRN